MYEKISGVIEGSGYNSVTDFVVYVLRDLVASQHHDQAHSKPQGENDIQRVKERLQALGYLDQ